MDLPLRRPRGLQPQPLHDVVKTGDLSDFGKLVVAVPGEAENGIVVRLGRIEDPVRRSDAQRRVARIRKLLDEA